jgi:molybdenum cofactor cytidylyltransferase
MISAVVLAAGQSKRMGQHKMLLPWGNRTVIEQIISTIFLAGIDDIHIVVGSLRNQLSIVLKEYKLEMIFNKDYRNGEMLTSIKLGIQSLHDETKAALIVLGDQPQINADIITAILTLYRSTNRQIIVPSYKMKRGHPLLIARPIWDSLLKIMPPMTLRDFLGVNNQLIDYLVVDSQSVLQDMDTPDDYFRYKP